MTEAEKSSRRALLVLGMHRSGTSAVTRVLNLAGAALGTHLMPPAADNPTGFWEHADVVATHETLLHALDRDWDDPRPLPHGWLYSDAAARARERLQAIVISEFSESPLWVIKDPRLCLMVPLWLDVLRRQNVNASFIFVSRDPAETAASLRMRDDQATGAAELLWMRYLLDAERDTRGQQRCLVTYEELLRDWRGCLARIAENLQVAWTCLDEQSAAIDAFLDPGHRHHVSSVDIKMGSAPQILARNLYSTCQMIEKRQQSWEFLAAARKSYEDLIEPVTAATEWLLSERRRLRESLIGKEHALSIAHTRLEGVETRMSGIEVALVHAEAGLVDAEAKLTDARSRIDDLLVQVRDLDSGLAAANALAAERADALIAAELREAGLIRLAKDLLTSSSWRITSPLRWASVHILGRPPAASLSCLQKDAGEPPQRTATGHLRSVVRAGRSALALAALAAYRRLPVPQRSKQRLKGLIFAAFPWGWKHTAAYRRWDAYQRTHAPDAARSNPRHLERDEAVSAVGPELWQANGRREWADYAEVQRRIQSAEEARREAIRVSPPQGLIELHHGTLEDAVKQLRLPMPVADPEVSIVIPAFGQLKYTLECLLSIAAHVDVDTPSFEVIIADDASPSDALNILRGIPHLRVMRQPKNLGFLRNCNTAAQEAQGRFLLFLNNDVQVTSGWLRALCRTLQAESNIGAVGPKIVYPNGWLQEAGARLRRDCTTEMIGIGDDPHLPRYAYDRDVDYCSGACLLVRADLFKKLGGFCDDFAPAYCEDADLCLRIREAGYRVVYSAGSAVVHHLSKTSDAVADDYKYDCIAKNLQTFSQRWQAVLDNKDDVRGIAFYLPQFHPIPENDLWWGRGFTEWTNVAKAKPNFEGHYQPRIPADLGYYDLRLPEVMQHQAALARRYGIYGFCYYYYWFNGKRLLERPIEQMLASGQPKYPFCLCWANENWTRRWDGQDREILIGQAHTDDDDGAVIRDLIRYFRSPSYIRIQGKPLVLVYRVTLFPDFSHTAAIWRQICRDDGIGDIYIANVESFELVSASKHPGTMGCDAAVEFPPQGMAEPYAQSAQFLNSSFNGAVADYRDLLMRYVTREIPSYRRFMCVMPGWDNTARRQNNSFCFEHATPGAFQAWVETAIARTKQQHAGDERLLFINAWNEWAEGAYLEPDLRYGHSFLQAFANARDSAHLLRRHKYALG